MKEMNQDELKKIKIISCSNGIYWYNLHIGVEFEVQRETQEYYWVRELDAYRCINFVLKSDTQLIN